MNRTLEEIADDLISHHIGWLSLNEYKRVAILAALTEAREGALREAEDVLQRYLSKQDHQNQTVYDATCIMIENIRLIASRPESAACIDCGASIHDHHVDGERLIHPEPAPESEEDPDRELLIATLRVALDTAADGLRSAAKYLRHVNAFASRPEPEAAPEREPWTQKCPACESPEKWGDQHAPWCRPSPRSETTEDR